ncbi:MAG: NAD(P)H-dependent oxidoreductase [Saprospiraceae bacterium]|nr:NAD(P)H-dependent oxidoreductase [Saprospiraceae bacterium]
MKIVAFGGSSSKKSINKQLATYATTFFKDEDIKILDLNDFEMPVFSVDKEKESGYPKEAMEFLRIIGTADLLIISLAEHNGSYSSAFKNIFDWASRAETKTFQNKPMLLMATSTGARGGKSVLEAAKIRFPYHTAKIIASFSLPEFAKNFDAKKGITEPVLLAQFNEVIDQTKSELPALK